MLKIVLFGLMAVFLSMVSGQVKREYGYLVAAASAMFLFSFGVAKISVIADEVREFEEAVGIPHEYVAILLKMAGIAYLGQFAVSLCQDAGQGAIAGQISFIGKICMLMVSMPVLRALVKMIGDFF